MAADEEFEFSDDDDELLEDEEVQLYLRDVCASRSPVLTQLLPLPGGAADRRWPPWTEKANGIWRRGGGRGRGHVFRGGGGGVW